MSRKFISSFISPSFIHLNNFKRIKRKLKVLFGIAEKIFQLLNKFVQFREELQFNEIIY